jgi:hypothetical protein
MPRRPEVTGGHDATVGGFCRRKNISRSTWNNWRRQGLTPDTVQPAGRGGKHIITPEAEAAWDQKHTVAAE